MKKRWEFLEEFPDDFRAEKQDLSDTVWQMLWSRKIREKEDIKRFLDPDFGRDVHDPFLFRDMEKAVQTVVRHIKEQNKITVYGDYDADGVTSSAMLVEILQILRADAAAYIPHRVTEGYGLNREAIESIAKDGAKLVITVDNGIRNREEVARAKELGLAVVVTDHHPAGNEDKLPDCPVVNPVLKRENYPYKYLAGVGVAFKLASALIQRSKLDHNDKKRLEDRLLDLVAIGTVADCVELLGENRVLVKYGLEALNSTRRPGLAELLKVAGINSAQTLDSWNIGFQIGPRLNAAGRLGRANSAYELLITRDSGRAVELAAKLNERNIDRQRQTEEITAAIENQLDLKDDDKIIIGVCPECDSGDIDDWNEGVIGLVAGRIQSKYYLPTLVITKTAEGYKGSGRSIPEFNMAEAIEQCGDVLDKYGGHPMACGFSLPEKNLDSFKKMITAIAGRTLKDLELAPKIKIEQKLSLEDINDGFLRGILEFAPFGQGNPKPVFMTAGAVILDIMNMGMDGQHIKLRIKQGDSGVFSAVGFGQSEAWAGLAVNDRIDIAYYLEFNDFNGRREIQLKIIDIKTGKADGQ